MGPTADGPKNLTLRFLMGALAPRRCTGRDIERMDPHHIHVYWTDVLGNQREGFSRDKTHP